VVRTKSGEEEERIQNKRTSTCQFCFSLQRPVIGTGDHCSGSSWFIVSDLEEEPLPSISCRCFFSFVTLDGSLSMWPVQSSAEGRIPRGGDLPSVLLLVDIDSLGLPQFPCMLMMNYPSISPAAYRGQRFAGSGSAAVGVLRQTVEDGLVFAGNTKPTGGERGN
jgi:hypothetical protein